MNSRLVAKRRNGVLRQRRVRPLKQTGAFSPELRPPGDTAEDDLPEMLEAQSLIEVTGAWVIDRGEEPRAAALGAVQGQQMEEQGGPESTIPASGCTASALISRKGRVTRRSPTMPRRRGRWGRACMLGLGFKGSHTPK